MEQGVETAVDKLLNQGLLGALLLLALFAIWKLYSQNQAIQEKRISEGQANLKLIEGVTQALRDLTNVHRGSH